MNQHDTRTTGSTRSSNGARPIADVLAEVGLNSKVAHSSGSKPQASAPKVQDSLADVLERISQKLPSADETADWPEYENTSLARFLKQVPRQLSHATFENFCAPTKEAKEAVDAIKQSIDMMIKTGTPHGILLFGPPGTGKDHLLVAAGKVLAKRGTIIYRASGAELFRRFRDSQMSGKAEEDLILSLMYPDILLLSDPVLNGVATPWQQQILYLVVDGRWSEAKPCWVSVNAHSTAELERLLGGQIVDRLCDGALVLQTKWTSYRRPFAKRA